MTEGANCPISLPKRVGSLENKFSVIEHRVNELAQERLPHRVTNLEGTAQTLHDEMSDIKLSIRTMSEQQQEQLMKINEKQENMSKRQASDSSFIRGAGWVVMPLLGVITIAVTILAFFQG